MKRFLIILFFVPILSVSQNKYGLKPTHLQEYKESLKSNPQKELVDLEKFIPGIVLDIRYATTNNFMHQKIYKLAKAYSRRSVAEALKKAQADFYKLGYGVKMFDAYRPYSATVKFYELYHDTTYVASPYRGSRHNRGCALDMTIGIASRSTSQPPPRRAMAMPAVRPVVAKRANVCRPPYAATMPAA